MEYNRSPAKAIEKIMIYENCGCMEGATYSKLPPAVSGGIILLAFLVKNVDGIRLIYYYNVQCMHRKFTFSVLGR